MKFARLFHCVAHTATCAKYLLIHVPKKLGIRRKMGAIKGKRTKFPPYCPSIGKKGYKG